MSNKDFLNNTLESFLECAKSKKIILFGAGDEMHNAFSLFLDCNQLKPAYVVDNDFRKWYSRVLGYMIREPDVLRDEIPDGSVVLITSIYPYRIKEQIERLGIVHYYSSLLFVEQRLGRQQFMIGF